MRFRCERDRLLETFTTAARAATSRGTTIAGAPSLRLALDGDHLEVSGSDPDLAIEIGLEVNGDVSGVTHLPARLAGDIVRSFDPGTVLLESTSDEVLVSSGRAEFSVRVPLGTEIARLTAGPTEEIAVPAALFGEGLRQVVRAALLDDSRAPQLTGVLMVATAAGLRLVATDSYRLAFCDLPGLSLLEDGTEVLIPARALAEVQRIISAAPGEGSEARAEKSLRFWRGQFDAVFQYGEVRLVTRLLQGQFPDYQRLVPPSYTSSVTARREDLIDALRRVRLLVRDSKDATTPVRLNSNESGMELVVLTPESGRSHEQIDAELSGEEMAVAFNPGYLLDGVEALRSERIVIETIDSSKPAQLRADDDADYRYLLMPVRVS